MWEKKRVFPLLFLTLFTSKHCLKIRTPPPAPRVGSERASTDSWHTPPQSWFCRHYKTKVVLSEVKCARLCSTVTRGYMSHFEKACKDASVMRPEHRCCVLTFTHQGHFLPSEMLFLGDTGTWRDLLYTLLLNTIEPDESESGQTILRSNMKINIKLTWTYLSEIGLDLLDCISVRCYRIWEVA